MQKEGENIEQKNKEQGMQKEGRRKVRILNKWTGIYEFITEEQELQNAEEEG